MRRVNVPTMLSVVLAALVLMPVTPARVDSQPGGDSPYCELELSFWNRNRYVYGDVNAECTYACPWADHSHAFGNWGVDSNLSGRWDGEQYRGWGTYNRYCDEGLSPPEWNSCTEYGRGNQEYFNRRGPGGEYNQQESNGETLHALQYNYYPTVDPFDSDGDGVIDHGGCRFIDGFQFNFQNNYMALYELDPVGGDDYLTTLTFPDIPLNLSCAYDWCPNQDSAWVDSHPDPITSTQIALRSVGTFVYR